MELMAVHIKRRGERRERVFYVSEECLAPFRSAIERDPLMSGRIVRVDKIDLAELEEMTSPTLASAA
jgi:hypothetical protein